MGKKISLCLLCWNGEAVFQGEAYVFPKQSTLVETYGRTVLTSDDHSDMMGVVAAAEGKAFGIAVSASATYMETESVSEQSVMYVLGTSVVKSNELIEFDQNLKLNPSDLDVLRKDPVQFLRLNGEYYVSSVEKGASYLASININEKTSSNSLSLSVFASLSTPFGGGSAGYEQAYADHSTKLQIEARG
jgi:hypothetical protein